MARGAARHQLNAEMGKLLVRAGAKLGLDEVAGQQHRPQPPRPPAPDIAGLDPVGRSERPDDRAMLAMWAHRADDRLGLDPHRQPRGWK